MISKFFARGLPSQTFDVPEMKDLKILIVDDDPSIRRLLSAMLKSTDYEIRTVSSGDEAIEAIAQDCPDLVVTDWEMPGLSGIELCRHIRKSKLDHYIYIVILTGKSDKESIVEGIESGADEFLVKPINKEELLVRIRACVRILELERHLKQLASTDALTGVLLRRTFQDQLAKEFERARRHSVQLSCALVDIDFFKRINDIHGHPTGDAVLKQTAATLQNNVRLSDTVCRYGGEEFCILLPETSELDAARWANRFRTQLSQLEFTANGKSFHITASIGISQYFPDTAKSEELIDQADQALLVAKQSGRDRVVRYSELTDDSSDALDAISRSDPFTGVLARDVMASPVTCLFDHDTIERAAEFFWQFHVNSAPVVNDEGRMVGIVSEKDVMSTMLVDEGWQQLVRDIMKKQVIAYEEDTPAKKVLEFLSRVSIRRVIIVNDGIPTGVIGRRNFLRWYHNWRQLNRPQDTPRVFRKGEQGASARLQLQNMANSLYSVSEHLHRELEKGPEDFAPLVVSHVSRMEEYLNELLKSANGTLQSINSTTQHAPIH